MHPRTGLVPDSTNPSASASVAGSGHALACYPIGVERGYVSRAHAIERTLTILRFFTHSDQGDGRNATGHRGFYYHFLDMASGRRVGRCELSTIDSAILLAGALVAAAYFTRDTESEAEIRALGDALYRRADWAWATNGSAGVAMGWTPERGFMRHKWMGYNEALLLYVLALGSPTHAVDAASYDAWTTTYRWKRLYGTAYLHGGPLFIHQLSHAFIDFRGIRDAYMRAKGIDYFENSRRATWIQREYAIRNPRGFTGYGPESWGISASDGPGPARRTRDDETRRFWGYHARGAPYGPDDGTLAPWAVAASLPFAPELVMPALIHLERAHPDVRSTFGYKCSYNATFSTGVDQLSGWVSGAYYAIDQGPVVLMIENHRSELVWRLMRSCPYVVNGLRGAGFSGGWLDDATAQHGVVASP